MNGTSSFEKGGLRRIFGRCDELTTENLPQSLFFKEGSAVRKTYQWLNTSNFNKPLAIRSLVARLPLWVSAFHIDRQ
jgi:hypothetical protein